jgi:hypothetical protein
VVPYTAPIQNEIRAMGHGCLYYYVYTDYDWTVRVDHRWLAQNWIRIAFHAWPFRFRIASCEGI